MGGEISQVHKFFALATEREKIKRLKEANSPKPWTKDPIFLNNRFCNVHREDDKTTTWFRNYVRDEVRDRSDEALAAIVAFRWFNKIETGEKIRDFLLGEWDTVRVHNKLANVKPVVTGAYIIKTPDGMNKLKGVLWCIEQFNLMLLEGLFDKIILGCVMMQEAQKILETAPYLGRFMAYQVIADARFTCLLEHAPDIMTWAQPGPGSTRGIGRIFYGDVDKFKYGSVSDEKEVIKLMQELLFGSRELGCDLGRPWEMQVIQNWCCEFDKYCRAEEGGHMKRKYS